MHFPMRFRWIAGREEIRQGRSRNGHQERIIAEIARYDTP
jgi:hypothetical protein